MKKNVLLLVIFLTWGLSAHSQELKLSEQQKLYGLSLLWSEAKYNFVYIDKLGAEWDSIYCSFIPEVQKALTVKAYYDVLKRFYSNLNDSHTNVYYPDSVQQRLNWPPLRTKLIEGKVVVRSVLNDSLLRIGIVPGLEVIRVNGIDAKEYGSRYVAPFACSATPQDRIKRTYDYQFLYGERNTPVVLTFKNDQGRIFTISVDRTLPVTIPSKPQLRYETVGDSIGLLTVSSFSVNNFQGIFDSVYPAILRSKALIIDLRKNGGGDGSKAIYILRHIIGKPFKTAEYSTWINNPIERTNPGSTPTWFLSKPDIYQPFEDVEQYKRPVIVLISAETHSAAEDFCMAFGFSQRGKLIGTATAGSTGRTYGFDLPGGGSARVCSKKDTYPDGREFVGIGIFPDIEVQETISSIRTGKDPTLERAVGELTRNISH